ncbi:hypothetical protein D3C72_2305970 [compost metagenome]
MDAAAENLPGGVSGQHDNGPERFEGSESLFSDTVEGRGKQRANLSCGDAANLSLRRKRGRPPPGIRLVGGRRTVC